MFTHCSCLVHDATEFEFSTKYTKLAMLSFLYCLCSEEQNNFSKKLPPAGIEPGILGLWDVLCVHSYTFQTEVFLSTYVIFRVLKFGKVVHTE